MQIPLDKLNLPTHDLRAAVDEDELDSLANSMQVRGQLQSIGVREIDGDRFEVVYGARRTRAARLLKWETIRAEIVTANDDQNTAADKLTENIQRQDLTPIEEAYGLIATVNGRDISPRELARELGKSTDWVKTRLALAELPDLLQQAVQAGQIAISVALTFGEITDERAIHYFLKQAATWGCTADQARAWVTQVDAVLTGLDNTAVTEDQMQAAIAEAEYIRTMVHCGKCKQPQIATTMAMLTLCRPCFSEVLDEHTGRPSTSTSYINGNGNRPER